MKIEKNTREFQPCPEYRGRAVCVDVTPLKVTTGKYGPRETLRFAFEVDLARDDGTRFVVWSAPFTPSCHEKAGLCKFINDWFGHKLTDSEWTAFDTEQVLGMPADIIVTHQTTDNGIYANIKFIAPYKGTEPLKPSGSFVRAKDRQSGVHGGATGQVGAAQPTAQQPAATIPTSSVHIPWKSIVVHVGTHKGHSLGELTDEARAALYTHWVPRATANPADQSLKAAILAWVTEKEKAEAAAAQQQQTDNIPY